MEPEVAWWESFHDPVLTDLIRRAARENRDVKIAAERLRAARAGETVSRSFLLPSVGAVGAAVDRSSGYGAPRSQALSRHQERAAPASTSRGRSISAVACARARRRPPPTRWPRNTACGACACW